MNGQQSFYLFAYLALVKRLRKRGRRDFRKDFFEVELPSVSLELVTENELIAFPLCQMRHENATSRIFAVAPERFISPRFLIPPSQTQSRNFSAGFIHMNLFDY